MKMSAESLGSEVSVSRPIYRLDQINQSLCYENEEISSKFVNYSKVLLCKPVRGAGDRIAGEFSQSSNICCIENCYDRQFQISFIQLVIKQCL